MEEESIEIPSKKSVRKAGNVLRSSGASKEEYAEAVQTLSQWRSIHAYPINTFQAYLRGKIKRDKYEAALVAQRLKRMPSIITKLQRFPSMQLDRMQDIGGLRVVLARMSDVKKMYESIVHSRRFGHEPELPPHDYIEQPKKDGYRSLHQIFKYVNKNHPELNGLRIELQIRTALQHSWATAVETLSIIEKVSLKTGEGSDAFKLFFKLSSALFSLDEKMPVIEEFKSMDIKEIVATLSQLEHELQIIKKLKGLTLSAKHIETTSKKSDAYHLMELNVEKGRISLIPFSENQLDSAEALYTARESATRDKPNIFVVLISAGNVAAIKKAYPNYFLDTNSFIRNLNRICGGKDA